MRASELFRGLGTVSSLTAASRVLGLIRDAGMAVLFGAGPLMDAFTVAFRLPNLARRLFGEGSLTAAFLPVFVREYAADEQRGREVAWATTVLLAIVLAVLTIAVELLLVLGLWLVDGPSNELLRLCVVLTPYVIWICVAAQLSAVLHALRRFFWPAVLPLILNVCWIAAILIGPRLTDDPSLQMLLIAGTVTLTGVVQVGVLLAVLRRLKFRWAWEPSGSRAATREIAAAVVPTMIGLSITQLNTVADSLLAWALSPSAGVSERFVFVEAGAATALYLGQRVHQVPLGVFGIALSTVLFPVFAEHAQQRRFAELGRDLTRGLQIVLIIGVPSSLGLILLGREIPTLLFEYGAFTARDSELTTRMLAGYGLGVWAFMALPILNRGFFAIGDRLTPMRIGLAVIVVHLVLNAAGAWLLGGAGLAVATSIAASVQVVWVVVLIHRRVAPLLAGPIVRTTGKVAASTIAMAVACRGSQLLLDNVGSTRVLDVLVPVAAAVVTYAAAAWGLGLQSILASTKVSKREKPPH